MRTPTLALAAAATAMAGLATPSFANPVEVKSETVAYSDLDLTTSEGRETLERRIEAAAKRVCSITPPTAADRTRRADANACLAKARASAKQQLAMATQDSRRGG